MPTWTAAHEFYNNSKFDLYQTFFGLAPGFYKLECNGFYRSGSAQEAAENYRDNEEDIPPCYMPEWTVRKMSNHSSLS